MSRHPSRTPMTALWHAGGFAAGPDEHLEQAHAYGLRLLLDGVEADVSRA